MAETFIKVDGLNRLINRFRRAERGILSEQLMGEIATYVITSILQRTARGVGADDKTFKPYSPKYRLFREETGHPGTPVSLNYSGPAGMLSAMTYKTSKDRAEIFFMNTSVQGQDVTNPEKAFYNQESRNFFAISSDEQAEIRNMVRRYIHNSLRE